MKLTSSDGWNLTLEPEYGHEIDYIKKLFGPFNVYGYPTVKSQWFGKEVRFINGVLVLEVSED